MFQKVAFTLFSVEDPLRARAFYEQTLGFTRGLASPEGTWTEYDLPGGGCLALFRHPDPKFARPPGGASTCQRCSRDTEGSACLSSLKRAAARRRETGSMETATAVRRSIPSPPQRVLRRKGSDALRKQCDPNPQQDCNLGPPRVRQVRGLLGLSI